MSADNRLYVFTGRMFAGKDFVAREADLPIKGFADPIYQLSEHCNGTANKSVPGIRSFLQKIGQWGWGCISEKYPVTMERSAFVERVRREGKIMTRDFWWVDWTQFGARRDFWVNVMLQRLGLSPIACPMTASSRSALVEAKPLQVAITNARFEHELGPLRKAGFAHYHVSCTEHTRRTRMVEAGYHFQQDEALDASEQLAITLDERMPDDHIIWNDTAPFPEGRHFLTVQEFVDKVAGQFTFDLRAEAHGVPA